MMMSSSDSAGPGVVSSGGVLASRERVEAEFFGPASADWLYKAAAAAAAVLLLISMV